MVASSAALGTVLLQKPSFETFAENHASIFQWITAAKNPIFDFCNKSIIHPQRVAALPSPGAGVRCAKTAGRGAGAEGWGPCRATRLPASPTRAGLATWPTAMVHQTASSHGQPHHPGTAPRTSTGPRLHDPSRGLLAQSGYLSRSFCITRSFPGALPTIALCPYPSFSHTRHSPP